MSGPRQLVHRGVVQAHGLLLMRDRRARALALWRPGVELRDTPHGLALIFATPRAVRAETALGAPLVSMGGRLVTAPIDSSKYGRGTMLTVVSGQAVELGGGAPVTPGDWLDLSAWAVAPVAGLGAPPDVARLPPAAPARVRDVFSDAVADADPASKALMAAMWRGPKRGGDAASWWGRVRGAVLGGLLGATRRVLATGGSKSAGGATGVGAAAGPPAPVKSAPDWRERLDQVLARLTLFAGLGAFLHEQHARYLQDVMRRFDEGDLDEALRRAIPINGPGGMRSVVAGWRTPRRREALTVGKPANVTRAVGLGDTAIESLRAAYNRALLRLKREERWAEAAFVVAELLGDVHGAVLLLETHGEYARAAELAETRDLSAGQQVRLWFLAGNVDRAVRIARRFDAYADAYQRLMVRDHASAPGFRRAWADCLAAQGHYGAAVRVLQHVDGEAPPEAWIDNAIAAGDVALIPMRVAGEPGCFDDLFAVVVALCGLSDARPREALAGSLHRTSLTDETRVIGRVVLRALLKDAGVRPPTARRAQLVRRLGLQLRGALGADLPDLEARTATPEVPRVVRVVAADRGAQRIHDAAGLPGGRTLLALGEAGTLLIDVDGRALRRWETPAHRLVVGVASAMAVALARRGDDWQLSRINLATGAASEWCRARLERFEDTSYAGVWVVVEQGRLVAVDLAATGWTALWSVDPEGRIQDVRAAVDACGVMVMGVDGRVEGWTYRMPVGRLQRRIEVKPLDGATARAVDPHGLVRQWRAGGGRVFVRWKPDLDEVELMERRGGFALRVTQTHALLVFRDGAVLVDRAAQRWLIDVRLGGSSAAGARILGDVLTVWDERGRVMQWLTDGELLVDVRV